MVIQLILSWKSSQDLAQERGVRDDNNQLHDGECDKKWKCESIHLFDDDSDDDVEELSNKLLFFFFRFYDDDDDDIDDDENDIQLI